MPFNPDEGFDQPNPEYWWERIGEADGQQKHPRRILVDSQYQVDYDRGYDAGDYFANILDRITL
jgi:hypothetical protein